MRRHLVPQDVPDLIEAMREAVREAPAIEVVGLKERAAWGNPLLEDRIAISTANLTRLVDYAPDDMVVTAEAGLSLAGLNERLSAHGQVLPLEVPFPDRTTLGGLVAAAPVPLARSGYGLVRDWLLGVEVVSSEGELLKSGARVVKSVAGYDLCKLYTGSLGTLGAIARVTFRVRPIPETHALLAARWTVAPLAEAALAAIQTTTLDPTLAILRVEQGNFELVAGFDGSKETVTWQCAEAIRLLEGLGGSPSAPQMGAEATHARTVLRDTLAGAPAAPLVIRISVLPSEVLRFVGEAGAHGEAFGVTCEAIAQAQQGTLWLSAHGGGDWLGWVEALRALAHAQGGSLVIERSPAPERIDAFGLDGMPLSLMRRLKAALDPSGCLAPGRLWPLTVE
jgi:glycolate oxidase FAD binding subunit